MDLLAFILVCYGMTMILKYSPLFKSWRPELDCDKTWTILFHCSMCIGWWVGLLISVLLPYTTLIMIEFSLGNSLMLSFLSAGTSYLLDSVVNDFGIKHHQN
jgi:hypothetical protein